MIMHSTHAARSIEVLAGGQFLDVGAAASGTTGVARP